MDMKEAARAARKCIDDLFQDEEIAQIGLEEVEFDSKADDWKITIGFTRPWEQNNSLITALGDRWPARSFAALQSRQHFIDLLPRQSTTTVPHQCLRVYLPQ